MTEYFISGIDTDIGKTIATGLMARYLFKQNQNIITQKIVQTGCQDTSDDILVHRQLMGCELFEEDLSGLTCPYLFKRPASPHLAARLEGKKIDTLTISRATHELKKRFKTILIEGAGGLQVPLNDDSTVLEYIRENHYPVILVTSSKLGSINHTLLSIEALKTRNIKLVGMVYNRYPQTDKLISDDSITQMRRFMIQCGYGGHIVEMGEMDLSRPDELDFSNFFNPV
ncbi:dethiobiotin synthase [Desulfobacula phenolica]|uniref:ATP-dependent dethiobiotin synthetase BioD n=1 Tax=Desulfobacula phenolica TaxID=90732 RepID=A0A1H2IG85_9BACT|nr:dethiobiotin synthase [Desulfobacula phenolica]SDU43170.1 dethiobiotin synthetase [Desulfobacula phenolica]